MHRHIHTGCSVKDFRILYFIGLWVSFTFYIKGIEYKDV